MAENKSAAGTSAVTVADMNRIIKEKDFNRLYVFYGEEEYLKDFYINALKKSVLGEEGFNYFRVDGKPVESELKDLCEELPMFGDKKVIVVRNSGLFKGTKKKDVEESQEDQTEVSSFDFLANLPEYCCLIFRESEADKRTKLYKFAQKNGIVFESARQKADIIIKVLQKRARIDQRDITPSAINLMINGMGNDITQLLGELEKLILFTTDGQMITEKHVSEVCELSPQSKIFDLTDAISEGNREKALKMLEALLSSREPSQLILVMIGRQFLQLYNVKQMQEMGTPQNEINEKLGVPEFVARKLANQAKNYSLNQLKRKIQCALDMDEAIKNGQMKDIMALELLVTM